jgi:hypothetical protein
LSDFMHPPVITLMAISQIKIYFIFLQYKGEFVIWI